MWEANGKGRSETRENDGDFSSRARGPLTPGGVLGESLTGEERPAVRLRNLTGTELLLIYRSADGSEVIRRIPRDATKVRVRYNRFFDRQPVEWYPDPEGSGGKIGTVESRPRLGVLPTCESIEGLPPAEGGVRLIVHPTVVFALARRGIFRRDLLTVGLGRKDPVTHRVIGYENLSRVDFDTPLDLAEVPSLEGEEDWRSE